LHQVARPKSIAPFGAEALVSGVPGPTKSAIAGSRFTTRNGFPRLAGRLRGPARHRRR